jgi:hypothetical protein
VRNNLLTFAGEIEKRMSVYVKRASEGCVETKRSPECLIRSPLNLTHRRSKRGQICRRRVDVIYIILYAGSPLRGGYCLVHHFS